jgi:hypothetical protein
MPSVQIKNVPPAVHRVLRRRAGQAGQSLQEYLLARLVEEAEQLTLEEVLAKVAERSGGHVPLADAEQVLRSERDAR